MYRDVNHFQILIRFQEPDNCRTDFVARLSDFTNYDGLVAANNPINAINVDIRLQNSEHHHPVSRPKIQCLFRSITTQKR